MNRYLSRYLSLVSLLGTMQYISKAGSGRYRVAQESPGVMLLVGGKFPAKIWQGCR